MNEQYVTEFFRGVEAPRAWARGPTMKLRRDGERSVAEVAFGSRGSDRRYADASGDDFAIDLDDDSRARSAFREGSPRLCTMAFTGPAVLEAAGVDDPEEFAGWPCGSALRCFPAIR